MKKDKVFYLHIPKTAGSSLNKFFSSQFDSDDVLTHIESKNIFENEVSIENTKKCKFLSGHVALPMMQHKLHVFDERTTIATFRIPLEHVISHIAWVRKLGEPAEEARLKQHTKIIQNIVEKLVQTDLSNAKEITQLIAWLEENNIYLFHDTQTKYLSGGPAGKVSPTLFNQAHINLNKLDFVGTVERLDEFLALLCFKNGWKLHETTKIVENKNDQTYGMDIHNSTIQQALQPLIEWDNVIYRIARERFIDDIHDFLAELEKASYARFSTVKDTSTLHQVLGGNNLVAHSFFTQGQLDQMVSDNYQKPDFLRDITRLLLQRGDIRNADKLISKALELRPDGPAIIQLKQMVSETK